MAHRIAYVMIIAVLVLLAWTIVDMYRGDRRLATLTAKAARQTDGRDAPVDDVEHDEETRQ
jgi:manganese transport protein